MIKAVTVTNHLGDSIKLELANPYDTGLAVRKIDGLGPVKASINTTSNASRDGSTFNSARLDNRNITLDLVFLPTKTEDIEAIRMKSYKYFPVKRNVTLLVETDSRSGVIEGYVESNEPDIFSESESTSISIICTDPHFYAVDETVTKFNNRSGSFEFAFSNESLTDKLLEVGVIENFEEQNVVYKGDTDTGLYISIHAVGRVDNLTLYNVLTHEKFGIDSEKLLDIVEENIKSGDDIYISTVRGKKAIALLREGKTYNILNAVDRNSSWFQIHRGDNIFTYDADSGKENLQVRIATRLIYEGM